MAKWLNLGEILKVNAKKFPQTIALMDKARKFTYPELNTRVNKLAHSLLQLGLSKGDAIAVYLPNTIEIVEFYLATAKTGLIIVPINIQLIGKDISYIVNNSDARALVVYDEFVPVIDAIKPSLTNLAEDKYIVVGKQQPGYQQYDDFIKESSENEPGIQVVPKDTWVLLFTSGTTGKPKGVVRSHESYIAFYLINAIDFGFNEHDICLNVMPLCHVNSTFFTFTFTYIGAAVYIHPERRFNAGEMLEIVEQRKITFISLIPTHYNLILNLPDQDKQRDVSSIRKLLCSSAPVRMEMKQAIMDFFPGVDLYEAYGSTEAGIVTVLKPEYQLKKLCSIGFESLGTELVKIITASGKEAGVKEIGELYSRGPMLFDEYYKLPEKTAASFHDGWFSAGDMAMYDEDGFYYIVDRKDNMIITGGEHVYPSEVETIIGNHPEVFDVAVIGLPDDKWGECVVAVVIAKKEMEAQAIIDYCREKMASFKRPKQVIFIDQEAMPRTSTGKILHRILRERYK